MEVKAKNVSSGDEISIVGDDRQLIADIILKELCSLNEVTGPAATYKTEYDFDIKNQDEIAKYILLSTAHQTTNVIHTVHIKTYYNGFPYNQISFYYYQ